MNKVVTLIDNGHQAVQVMVSFDFDYQLLGLVKSLPCRSWDKKNRCWYLPINADLPVSLARLRANGFIIDATVSDAAEVYKRQISEYIELTSQRNIELPDEAIYNNLYPFQKVGVKFLSEVKNGLLCFDVGLGKTYTVIATLLHSGLYRSKVLIIVPKSVLWQFAGEIESRVPGVKFKVVSGTIWQRNNIYHGDDWNWLIMGYEIARLDYGKYPSNWSAVVFDEVQKLASVKSQVHKTLRKIEAPMKIGMSATPIMNRLEDAFGIMDCIRPGSLGSYWDFQNRYCIKDHWGSVVDYRDIEHLRSRLAPMMIRRTLDDADVILPSLTQVPVYVEFSAEEKKLYKEIREELLFEIEHKYLDKLDSPMVLQNVLTKMGKLIELSDSMELLGSSTTSSKLEAVKELVSEINGKVVIFSKFTRMVDILSREFSEYNPVLIKGDKNDDERREALEQFRTNDKVRMMISSDAGGAGISLEFCSYLINYDLPWSYGKYWQRVGRIRRINSTKPMFVYNMIIRGTIDKYLERVLMDKRAISNSLIERESIFANISEVKEALE